MQKERERIEAKLATLEVGSVEYNLFREILSDLDSRPVTLHVDADAVCESCQ